MTDVIAWAVYEDVAVMLPNVTECPTCGTPINHLGEPPSRCPECSEDAGPAAPV